MQLEEGQGVYVRMEIVTHGLSVKGERSIVRGKIRVYITAQLKAKM